MSFTVSQGLKSAASSIAQILASLVGQNVVAASFTATSQNGFTLSNTASAPNRIISNAPDAVTTSTVPSISILPATALNSADLIFSVADAVGTNLFMVTYGGVTRTVGDLAIGSGGGDITTVRNVTLTGALTLPNTDTSGTPGNATANTASGRSAIAAGASSCVISNTLVTAAARIFISPKIRDATGLLPIVSAQVAATSFTVSTTANCTANLTFDWWLVL